MFYRHKMMADGLLGKCTECTKLDSVIRRASKLGVVQEYDRSRSKLHHRVEARRIWTANSRMGHFSLKAKAEAKAYRALKCGRIKKQKCNDCGGESSDMHHEDYSKPLSVTWLCVKCHHARHRKYDYEMTLKSRSLVLAQRQVLE